MRTRTLFVAVAVAVAAFASVCRPVQAAATMPTTMIAATCKAAHDADRHVSSIFCRTHLIAQRGAHDADVWGLAKIAAVMGVNHADAARYEIARTMKSPRGDDPKFRRALERCDGLYGSARAAYAAANEALIERRYGDAKKSLVGIPALGHECEFAFAGTSKASPLMYYSVDNQQIAYLTLAITNLIK